MVDLRVFLGIEPSVDLDQSKVIIAEFNEVKLGFVVDAVELIYRINFGIIQIVQQPGQPPEFGVVPQTQGQGAQDNFRLRAVTTRRARATGQFINYGIL